MYIRFCVFVFCSLFSANSVYSQKSQKSAKYEFQDYRNNSLRKLKSGKFITVELESSDTIHIYSGVFLSLESDSLYLDTAEESFIYADDSFAETFELNKTFSNQKIAIHKTQIKKITYNSFFNQVGNTLSAVGLVGLIFGPLAALDKDANEGFNTRRYKRILRYSGLALGTGQLMVLGGMTELKIP